jgi:phosphopantothenate-cysteine ligase
MKRILITGGPTNEYIDEVMKITNMSSGKVAIQMAENFVEGDYEVTLLLTKTIKYEPVSDKITLLRFETTDELERAIKTESEYQHYDAVIHSAAVADYKPEFSFRMEDMAYELTTYVKENSKGVENERELYNDIFNILTNPNCKVNDSSKISSNESHLTVKLGLTTKIIYNLRKWFPNAFICGFKLLENVSEQELVDAALRVIDKSGVNLVFANDLAELRQGNVRRLVISRRCPTGLIADGAADIADIVKRNLYLLDLYKSNEC